MDLTSRQIKETYPYTAIQSARPSQSDPRTVQLKYVPENKTSAKSESFVLDFRTPFLAALHSAMTTTLLPPPLGIFEAYGEDIQVFPVELAIAGRVHNLADLIQVYRVLPHANPPDEVLVLVWRDGTQHTLVFNCANEALASSFLELIESTVQASLGESFRKADITPEQETDLLQASALRGQDGDYPFYGPIELISSPSFAPGPAFLALTPTSVLFLDQENGATMALNHVRKLLALELYVDAIQNRIAFLFSHSPPIVLEADAAQELVANLVAMAPWLGGHLEIRHLPIHRSLTLGPLWMDPSPEREALVLAPLSSALDAQPLLPAALQAAAKEYLANVRPGGAVSKNKKPFLKIASLLLTSLDTTAANDRVAPVQARRPTILSPETRLFLANVIVHGLSSQYLYTDAASSPVLPTLAWDALRSSDMYMVLAGARLLVALVDQTYSSKNPKAEKANRAAVFDTPHRARTLVAIIGKLLSPSVAQTPFRSAAIAALSHVLASLLASPRIVSTPDHVLASLTAALYASPATLFALARFESRFVQRNAINTLRAILELLPPDAFTALQNKTRASGNLLSLILCAASGPSPYLRLSATAALTLLVEGNEPSVEVLERIFPKPLIHKMLHIASDPSYPVPNSTVLYAPPWQKSDQLPYPPKPSPGPLVPASCATSLWSYLFDMIAVDFFEPTFIWDARTRAELSSRLQAEMDAFSTAKANAPQGTGIRWNSEEFDVEYTSLASELRVGHYYLDAILERIPDVSLIDPAAFVQELSHELTFGTIPRVRCRILQALSWAYATYMPILGVYKYMDPLVMLLQPPTLGEVRDHVLLFLAQAFVYQDNIKAFVAAGGLAPLMVHLTNVHLLPTQVAPSDDPMIGSIILELLIQAASLVPSTDSDGRVLYPPPKVKTHLAHPETLGHIAQIVLSGQDQLVQRALLLIDHIVRHNPPAISALRNTGIALFLLLHPEGMTLAGAEVLRLLQVSHPLEHVLPDTLMSILIKQGAAKFHDVFTGSKDSPYLVWNATTRDTLVHALASHLEPFLETLAGDPHALYVYQDPPPVSYPSLDQELVVEGVFVRNMVNLARFPSTVLPEPTDFVPGLTQILENESDASPEKIQHTMTALAIVMAKHPTAAPVTSFAAMPSLLSILSRTPSPVQEWRTVIAALEVVLRAVMASPENRAHFLNNDGLSVLDSVLHACLASDMASLMAQEGTELALRVLEQVAWSDESRTRILLAPHIVDDTVAAVFLFTARPVVRMALRAVAAMSRDGALQDKILASGGVPAILGGITRFTGPQGVDALRALAGVDPSTPPNGRVARDVLEYTDGEFATAVADVGLSSEDVVQVLLKPVRTPERVWTRDCVRELSAFCDRVAAHELDSASPLENGFALPSRDAEPVVAGVYITYLPPKILGGYAPSDPDALPAFVQGLVARVTVAPAQSGRALSSVAAAAGMGPVARVLGEMDDGVAALCGAAEHPQIASFLMDMAEETETGLGVLMEAGIGMVVDLLLPTAATVGSVRSPLLYVSWAIVSGSDALLGAFAASAPGIRTLLQIIAQASPCDPGVDDQDRNRAAVILSNALRLGGEGEEEAHATLVRWIPEFFARVLLVAPAKMVALFDSEVRRPNVIWTEAIAARVKEALGDPEVDEVDWSARSTDLEIGGVYVHALVEEGERKPWSGLGVWMANPGSFVKQVMSSVVEGSVEGEDLVVVLKALEMAVTGVPSSIAVGDTVVSFVAWVLQRDPGSEVMDVGFRIVVQLLAYREVLRKLSMVDEDTLGSVGVSALLGVGKAHAEYFVDVLDVVREMVRAEQVFVDEGMECGLVGEMLNVLASPSSPGELDSAAAGVLLVLTQNAGVGVELAERLEEPRNVSIWAPWAVEAVPADTTVSLSVIAQEVGGTEDDGGNTDDDGGTDDFDVDRLVLVTKRLREGEDAPSTPVVKPEGAPAFAFAYDDDDDDDQVEESLGEGVWAGLEDGVGGEGGVEEGEEEGEGEGEGEEGDEGVDVEEEGDEGVDGGGVVMPMSTLDMLAEIRMGTKLREVDEEAIEQARSQHREENGLAGAILSAMEGRRGAMCISTEDLGVWDDGDDDW